jgi:hypothetical protein
MARRITTSGCILACVLMVTGLASVLTVAGLVVFAWWSYETRRAEEEQGAAQVEACGSCLPGNFFLDSDFAFEPNRADSSGKRLSITTVRRKLLDLGAYCKDGVIYDRHGKRVLFFQVTEWGARPTRELEEWARQRELDVERLEREGWTVIRMWRTRIPH